MLGLLQPMPIIARMLRQRIIETDISQVGRAESKSQLENCQNTYGEFFEKLEAPVIPPASPHPG